MFLLSKISRSPVSLLVAVTSKSLNVSGAITRSTAKSPNKIFPSESRLFCHISSTSLPPELIIFCKTLSCLVSSFKDSSCSEGDNDPRADFCWSISCKRLLHRPITSFCSKKSEILLRIVVLSNSSSGLPSLLMRNPSPSNPFRFVSLVICLYFSLLIPVAIMAAVKEPAEEPATASSPLRIPPLDKASCAPE